MSPIFNHFNVVFLTHCILISFAVKKCYEIGNLYPTYFIQLGSAYSTCITFRFYAKC